MRARPPDFCALIRTLEQAGYKRLHVANELGVAPSTITRIANDRRHPRYDTGHALLVFANRVLPEGKKN